MKARGPAFVVAAFVAAAAPAQTEWRLCGSDAVVRVGGAATAELQGPRAARSQLAAGDIVVHFGVDALGKPVSLAFPVPAGAMVQVAVEPAGPAARRSLAVAGSGWTETAGTDTVRTTGSLEEGDYRLEVRQEPAAGTAVVGLVARWRSATQFYAFVLDRERGEVRFERHLGPDALVLARAAAPQAVAGARTLALQVQGFRLQGLIDDAIVLQMFDGALTNGACGVCWRGTGPAWGELRLGPPVPPRASAALVQEPGVAATFHAATTVTPGHWYVLELRLDRPHPLVPTDSAGLEPWLLGRAAAPEVLRTDLRGLLGRGTFGEVPPDGGVHFPVEWPDLPALRLHVAMARALLVTADGCEVTAATPAVPVRFWLP